MSKFNKNFGVDFQGHKEEAMELLLQIDSSRQARRIVQDSECRKTRLNGMYAPNSYKERRLVWEELGSVRGLMEWPWAVCGDYNVTRFISEKKNCDNLEIASRIDRKLISKEFDDSFNNLKQIPLQRLVSDHIPVALQGKPEYILACKLKALKSNLKTWSRSEDGNLGSKRRSLVGQMAEMDVVLEERVLTEEESIKKVTLLIEYKELVKNEEISWRQKSRSLWLKEGDKNTKFFQKMANAHRRYNNIDQLVIQGETIEELARIEEEIIDYYQKLYSETT
ncbi:uncharacterized protein LOC132639474 [Lycium barbarum]|uniref:uncharacterized protein LOC132639474 n=1 Tax=Lycium barbarum TaxID=112863 RepID=UPI00293EA00C|nr:uncharacterized protein LOC132639474 [Lycium barbarum]